MRTAWALKTAGVTWMTSALLEVKCSTILWTKLKPSTWPERITVLVWHSSAMCLRARVSATFIRCCSVQNFPSRPPLLFALVKETIRISTSFSVHKQAYFYPHLVPRNKVTVFTARLAVFDTAAIFTFRKAKLLEEVRYRVHCIKHTPANL